MYTSYFGNLRNLPTDVRQVSICRNPPEWFKGDVLYQTAMPLREYDGNNPVISTDEYRTRHGMVVVLSTKPLTKYSMKLLSPMSKTFNKYLKDRNFFEFAEKYKEEVLWRLDAKRIVAELGENSCMLCFEVDDLECHRSIVREWFNKNNVECSEICG